MADEKLSHSRVPPNNFEAEKSVLGAILLRNSAIFDVLETGLESRDFYRESHQVLFDVLRELSEKGEPIDLVTLTSALRDRGQYERVGGSAALTSLFEDNFAVKNAAYYAKIVRDKALLRRMIDAANEIASDAFDGVEDMEIFMDESERKVFAVSNVRLTKTFASMSSILVGNMQMIEELSQRKSIITGLQTGLIGFDRMTSGLHPGQLIIVAGRPGMGKTSIALSMVQNAALNEKSVIALFSLEMSQDELGFKLISGVSRIDSKKLKTGRLADRDWPRLAQAADLLSKSKIYIDDSGNLTVMDMRARCRRLLAENKKLDLIVVDYLQLMQGSKASTRGESSREREISEISRNLKSLAKELKVPIIALSQLNRGVEARQDKRPMLSDLRESGAIEQDADMVMFVYRDEVYNKESEDRGIAELIIAKHRAGELGTVRLAWLPECTSFGNLAEDSPGMPIPGGPRPERGDITL